MVRAIALSATREMGLAHTHPGSWRAVWAYSHKRAVRDRRTFAAQEQRARAVVDGQKRPGLRGSSRPATGHKPSIKLRWTAPADWWA